MGRIMLIVFQRKEFFLLRCDAVALGKSVSEERIASIIRVENISEL
jgi:hypothetical protein